MRFMMLVKADKGYEAGAPPNPELMAAIAKLAEEATARGEMVTAGGLLPSSQGVRIRVARGKTSVIDGPFAETKELVGGYAIFDLKSKEQAIEPGSDLCRSTRIYSGRPTKENWRFVRCSTGRRSTQNRHG